MRLFITKKVFFKKFKPQRSACNHRYEDGEGCTNTWYATSNM